MTDNLFGIIPPMVTPFDDREELDAAALAADVDYLIEVGGVHGLAVGGSTGEGHTLTDGELRTAVGTAVEAAAGRVPVIAGVIVDSTRQACSRVRVLADLDVAALQVTPVHYLFKPTDGMHLRHFASMAEVVDIPILIYNVVPHIYLSPQLLTRIMREVPAVQGVKQSAGDMKLLADLLLLADPADTILSAVDALLYPSFCLGPQGAIAAILTAAPATCVALWDAVRDGDHGLALELHHQLLPVWNAIEGDNLPAAVRAVMALQGRNGGLPRSPMSPASDAQIAAIGEAAAGLVHERSLAVV